MNISENIESLFTKGVVAMTIGQPPRGGGQVPNYFLKGQQVLATGDVGCNAEIVHQVVGDTPEEVFEKMEAQVTTANALAKEPSALVKLPRNN